MQTPLEFFFSLFPLLLAGVWMTLKLLVISGIVGNLLAVPVALARVSHNPLLWIPSYLYILVMRGTPLLAQIYLIYYGLGSLFPGIPGLRESFLWPYLRDGFYYVCLALSLNVAGYSGEILRGGIQAVPNGEIEACKAFGMSRWMMLRRVILPRAFRITLPAFSGEVILLLKATALASTVAVAEVLGMVQKIRADTFRTYEPLLAAAVIYIILTFIITRGFNYMERRLNKDRVAPKTLSMAGAAAKPAA
jgi:polar amino acid transport system permease protein